MKEARHKEYTLDNSIIIKFQNRRHKPMASEVWTVNLALPRVG